MFTDILIGLLSRVVPLRNKVCLFIVVGKTLLILHSSADFFYKLLPPLNIRKLCVCMVCTCVCVCVCV